MHSILKCCTIILFNMRVGFLSAWGSGAEFWQAKDGSVTAWVPKRVSSVLYLTVTDPRMLRPLKVSSSSERMTAVLRRCRSTVMYTVFVCVCVSYVFRLLGRSNLQAVHQSREKEVICIKTWVTAL
jgi:hypothetical protein